MGNENTSYMGPSYYPQGVIQSVVQQSSLQNQLSIRLNKPDYFKGDYVEGSIILNSPGSVVLNDIHLNLFLSENWNYIENNQPQSELNNQMLLTIKIGIQKILKINSDLINLNPGAFNFPFKFKLPDYLQPSFEYPKDNQRGFLRYVLQAKIISNFVRGETSVLIFIKSRPIILNCPLSFSSAINVHKWGMFDEGSTILKVSYLTSNYQIRSQIPFTVEINNTRGKLQVKSVIAKIIRRVQFRNVREATVRYTLQSILVNKEFAVNVPPNTQSQVYNYNIELSDSTLQSFNYNGFSKPYPMLVDLLYAMPTTDGAAIKCDYFLLVSLSFTSFVTQGYIPKVCIPFTMTHQKQNDYSLEQREDEDLKRAIEASLLDAKKFNNVNEININEVDSNKNKNEIIIDEENNQQNNNFIDINQVDDNINNNNSQYNNNNNNSQYNNNQIMDNVNNNINNNINININNNMNNNINNNININKISNEYNHMNNNNNNNIHFEENDNDIINPYQQDLENQEQNNVGPKNFSINDFDDDNDNDIIK